MTKVPDEFGVATPPAATAVTGVLYHSDQPTSARSILSAIRLTSFTSILAISFGIATNKVIAVISGTEGVGLLGLYRTVSGIVAVVLPLGVNEVIVQRLSTSREWSAHDRVVGASLTFLALQISLILCLAAFAARPVANWLFTSGDAAPHLWEIRLVIGLTAGVLLLQSVTASLNGLFRLHEVNRVTLMTSLLTLLTVYPFLLLGRIGLTFIIGFTCFIGAAYGIVHLQKAIGRSLWRLERPRNWSEFRAILPISPWLAIQPILNTGSALTVQIVLSRHYGLDALGYYNAAAMIETTSITVLMSSMRSYYLPALGRFPALTDKRIFINKIVSVLLALLLLGAMLLVLTAPLAVKVLFSGAFGPARDIVLVLALSMVAQVLVWCSALFLLHSADYRTFVLLDSAWACLRILGTILCGLFDAPLQAVAWVHMGSYMLSAAFYAIWIRFRYRVFLIDGLNLAFSVLVLGLLITARLVALHRPIGEQAIFGVIVAGLCGVSGTYALRRIRS